MTDREQKGAAGLDRLRKRIARVRARGGRIAWERWLFVIGGAALAAGIAMIIVGWYGAAHTPYTFEQIPYMISGGLLGLAVAIVGGLFYFSFWLTRQVQETRRQGEEQRRALLRLEKALLAGARNGNGSTSPANGGMTLVATRTGTMIHRPDCPVVANRDDVRRIAAGTPGFEPCKICDPLGAPAN